MLFVILLIVLRMIEICLSSGKLELLIDLFFLKLGTYQRGLINCFQQI